MIGKTFSTKEAVRMIPDILQNGEQFFFPIFSSVRNGRIRRTLLKSTEAYLRGHSNGTK